MHALSRLACRARLSLPIDALALTAAPLCAQQLWIVDAASGAGAQFTAIQPAIDAASAGDTVFVRAGHYAGFALHAKGVNVVSHASSATFVDSNVRIEHIPDAHGVALVGFTIAPPQLGPALAGAALTIADNDGAIWLQECAIAGADVNVGSAAGGVAVEIVASSDVAFSSCALRGGRGGPNGGASGLMLHGLGGNALSMDHAHALLMQTTAHGGAGGQQSSSGYFHPYGGAAAAVTKAQLEAWSSEFVGGASGANLAPVGYVLGGNGIDVVGTGALARISACITKGGAATTSNALPGAPVFAYYGGAASLQSSENGLVFVGAPVQATSGDSIQLVWMDNSANGGFGIGLITPTSSMAYSDAVAQVLLDPSGGQLLALGAVSPNFVNSVIWNVPQLPAGLDATTAWIQVGIVTPSPASQPLMALSVPRSLTLTRSD